MSILEYGSESCIIFSPVAGAGAKRFDLFQYMLERLGKCWRMAKSFDLPPGDGRRKFLGGSGRLDFVF